MPDNTINHTASGWPLLDPQNFVKVMPAYTAELADKLENSDAAVAAAINTAHAAQALVAEAVQVANDITFRVASGSVSLALSGASSGLCTITFPAGLFTAPPAFFPSLSIAVGGTAPIMVTRDLAVTATQATFTVAVSPTPGVGSMVRVHWFALQTGVFS